MANLNEFQPDEQTYLGSLAQQILAHWKEHRPHLYRRLQKEGTLDVDARQLERSLEQRLQFLMSRQHLMYQEAWELLQSEAFPPAEDDVPVLGSNPA